VNNASVVCFVGNLIPEIQVLSRRLMTTYSGLSVAIAGRGEMVLRLSGKSRPKSRANGRSWASWSHVRTSRPHKTNYLSIRRNFKAESTAPEAFHAISFSSLKRCSPGQLDRNLDSPYDHNVGAILVFYTCIETGLDTYIWIIAT